MSVAEDLEANKDIPVSRMIFKLSTWILRSPDRPTATRWLVLTLAILCGVSCWINVRWAKACGEFQQTLKDEDEDAFWASFQYIFGLMIFYSSVGCFEAYVKNWINVLTTGWISKKLTKRYCESNNFYALDVSKEVEDPGLRIHDDAKALEGIAHMFFYVAECEITACLFVYELYQASPVLSAALMGYAAFGLAVGFYFLMKISYWKEEECQKEANLRSGLCRLGENSESIAFYAAGKAEESWLAQKIDTLTGTRYASVNWKMGKRFFMSMYRRLAWVAPYWFLADAYFKKDIKFSVFTESRVAFAEVLQGFLIILCQIDSVSRIKSSTKRMYDFIRALDRQDKKKTITTTVESEDEQAKETPKSHKQTVNATGAVKLNKVTVCPPRSNTALVKDLTLDHGKDQSLLIMGASGAGKSSILRAICGLWEPRSGTISRPAKKDCLFLPQVPYIPEIPITENTLKAQLLFPRTEGNNTDEEMLNALERVNLIHLAGKSRRLDVTNYWRLNLSVGEKQRLAMARLLLSNPKVAFLDESTSALDNNNEALLYSTLAKRSCSYISVGHRLELQKYHSHILEIQGEGKWEIRPSPMYIGQPALTSGSDTQSIVKSIAG